MHITKNANDNHSILDHVIANIEKVNIEIVPASISDYYAVRTKQEIEKPMGEYKY